MTITTEEAEAHATALERGSILYRAHAAKALRALAAERDIANEQIYGLAEERERWKERAERAEAEAEKLRDSVTAVIIAYEYDIAQDVEPSDDRRRVIAVLRAALEGGDNADRE